MPLTGQRISHDRMRIHCARQGAWASWECCCSPRTAADDGYTAANPALRDGAGQRAADAEGPQHGSGTFDLASMLPPPRRGNAGASRPYVYYDGAQATPCH